MNRKLSDWASVAEIIASIAVVITLLLVVANMRENTNALQVNTYQELMRDITGFRVSARDAGLSLSAEGFSEVIATGQRDRLERLGYLILRMRTFSSVLLAQANTYRGSRNPSPAEFASGYRRR